MSDTSGAGERKVSYGIGGAGNIRKPSEPLSYMRITPSHPKDGDAGRRRGSILASFSSSTPGERRASLMNIFRRGSNGEDRAEAKSHTTTHMDGGSKIEFRDVDLGGKKKGQRQEQGLDGVH